MKPLVARKLAAGHMCPTASFLATGGFKFLHGLSTSNLLLKDEVEGRGLNSHGNYIADHGHVFFIFSGNPVTVCVLLITYQIT